MTLISCPECKNEISSKANSCHRCGYSLAKGKDKKSSSGCSTGCLGIVLISFILVIIGPLCYLGSDSPRSSFSSSRRSGTSSKSSASTGRGKRIFVGTWFGCTDLKHLAELTQLVDQGKRGAFQTLLGIGQITGTCTVFKDGEVVYLADEPILRSFIKVRREGEVQEYWTFTEAVK